MSRAPSQDRAKAYGGQIRRRSRRLCSKPDIGHWPTPTPTKIGLLPAVDRYDGTFYRCADLALTEAASAGRLLIISGGYGVVRADEPISGWANEPAHRKLRVSGVWNVDHVADQCQREAIEMPRRLIEGVMSGSNGAVSRGYTAHDTAQPP